ncbi:putative anti-sigma regulatory factor, serine/threonine protein kinase [Shewanella halifaxensis HAW-EB4]|uniref:Anti-sigma regulatory factor, serine/threonine protein kinase n=1 Tax=Shewanella halifaxensis (strain HAW-EB4) TaxID=458817 RepID=B0TL04_SHEHH|nr:ATP-binding protein [Shewanella halifaxensis]ABZ77206.1 putative anti-sigma regulatory factor, serine/threonine protein kinase [Shewanella halifaxensis HAW-EB4]
MRPDYLQKDNLFICEIIEEADVYYIAGVSKVIAEHLGFLAYESGLIFIAVSEIAMNVIRHAERGMATITRTSNNKGLEIHIDDYGPGIQNLTDAMCDGYSTYGSMGMGFGAARRSVDELIVQKSDPSGTSITLRKYLPVPDDFVDIGVVSLPAVDANLNTNEHMIIEYEGDKVLVALLKCVEQRLKTSVITDISKEIIKENCRLPLEQLIEKCSCTLKASEHACRFELALLRLAGDTVEFASLGSIGIHAHSIPQICFSIQKENDDLIMLEKINVMRFSRPIPFCFILHSGFLPYFHFSSIDQCSNSSKSIAMSIFDQYAASHDESDTVIVMKG